MSCPAKAGATRVASASAGQLALKFVLHATSKGPRLSLSLTPMKCLLLYFGIAVCLFACQEPPAEKQLVTPTPNSPSADILQEKPFVSFSLDKQNIVYIGVDNPVTIHTNGLKDKDFTISTSAGLSYRGGRRYGILRGLKQGAEKIIVLHKGEVLDEYVVRVMWMPDPKAYLGNATSGGFEAEEFRAQRGIHALIRYMDIQGTCQIVGFKLLRVSKDNDRDRSINKGGSFDGPTKAIIQRAEAGDVYQFTRVLAKCPGDEVNRELNPLAFEIR